MRKFSYEARDQASNKIVKSVIQADSENAAGRLLIRQGFTPLKISPIDERPSVFSFADGRIKTKDKIVFSRQMATLIGAGLPLAQSLHTVLDQTQNKKMQSVIQEVSASVEGGKSFSAALSKFPDVFDPVLISLVSAGEISGNLDEALIRIAAQQEKDAAIMSKIKGAMTYPIIVMVVIFGVMTFMLVTVVPQVEKLYDDLNKEMPLISQVMVAGANVITSYWWIVLIVIGFAVFAFRQLLKTKPGINIKDNVKIKTPFIGPLFEKLYMSRFNRTGQTLLASGVSMLDMLRITSKAMNNSILEAAIVRASEKVKSGKALSTSLEAEQPLITTLVPQMIKIGEQSGKIDEMMGKVAQIYEDELDNQIKNISTLIEPMLMVILAIFAGLMVAAILLPIYSLVGNVNI